MRVNVEKVLERDQKLSELDDRAGQYHVVKLYKRLEVSTVVNDPYVLGGITSPLTKSLCLNVTDALQQGASQFEQQAGKLKRKFWWKNLKVLC